MAGTTYVPPRRHASWPGSVIVCAGLLASLASFLILSGLTPVVPDNGVVRVTLGVNGLLVLSLLGVVGVEGGRVLRARLKNEAAAGLHVRFVTVFAGVAALPALLIAGAASVTFERGLDPWFTGQLSGLMTQAVEVARTYRDAQCRSLARETDLMANDLGRAKAVFDADRRAFRDYMASRSLLLGLPVASLVTEDGTVIETVEHRPLAGMAALGPTDLAESVEGEALCLVPAQGDTYRALIKLPAFEDMHLVTSRAVDPRAVAFPKQAEEAKALYDTFEQRRFGVQVAFASMYALITLTLLLAAIRWGLTFADRLVAPIRRMIHATDEVAAGNFYVQVPIRRGEGDLAHLSNTFNKMTSELRNQHDGLVFASEDLDRRRRFTEAVLAGVSSGVIGLDGRGEVTVMNPAAEALLSAEGLGTGRPLADAVPSLAGLLGEAADTGRRVSEGQVGLSVQNRERLVDVRVAAEPGPDGTPFYVVTLDDITDIVAAQRASAWADVARRIAHEIKNPLTPIQLSAERIRRKYGRMIVADREVFDRCVETIIRQVDDIRRMVDEFSSFARMPKPRFEYGNLAETIRQTVFMLQVAHPEIDFKVIIDENLMASFDPRLLGQAFGNVLKNSAEALSESPPFSGRGRISVEAGGNGDRISIDVTDNGRGFPTEDRDRLLEPYVTTREGGTGLGLPIVAKILEEHGGGIELHDGPGGQGAMVRLHLPLSTPLATGVAA